MLPALLLSCLLTDLTEPLAQARREAGAGVIAAGDGDEPASPGETHRGNDSAVDAGRAEDAPSQMHAAFSLRSSAFGLQPSAFSLASMRRLNSSDWPRGIERVFQCDPCRCFASSRI